MPKRPVLFDVRLRRMGFNPSVLAMSAVVMLASCVESEDVSTTPVYRMTYTDISLTTRGFHARALASSDPDLSGEGCVRTISEAEALQFVSALRVGQPRRDDSITVEDAGVMTISDSRGRFAGPLSVYQARDFEGNIYETSRAQWLSIGRTGLQILRDNGCEDARYRLEIVPYH